MKNILNIIRENIILIIAVLAVGLIIGYVVGTPSSKAESKDSKEALVDINEQIFTCSMHPQIRQKGPGLCPICAMELIPSVSGSTDNSGSNPNEIQMSESAMQLANIQTTIVRRGQLVREINLLGRVEVDESRMYEISARFNGRIEKLFVNFTGQKVTKGQLLAKVYSPQLVTAQKELLEALNYKDSKPEIYKSAIGKLKLWDLTDRQIKSIIKNGKPILYFDILSPITGVVSVRHISLGDYVKQGQQMFMVADLSKVWIMFDAYQADLPWIVVNDDVEFSLPSVSGQKLKGKVKYIDPIINPKTRVAKVRVEYSNTDFKIKPDMFVDGVIKSSVNNVKNRLLVPKTAVLWTGKRAVVYVKLKDRESPTFLYREIVLGPDAGNYYVVEEGLKEGEEIATNGVFKIDASAQLMGLTSMMNPDGGGIEVKGHNDDNKHITNDEMAIMDDHQHQIEVDVKFKRQLTNVYQQYLVLKDDFVASNSNKAIISAKEIAKAISNVDMKLVSGNAHILWMEHMKALNESIKLIKNSRDIEEQRKAFSVLSLSFYKSVRVFGLEGAVTYYQYCPMANTDKGAFWFSNSKEIQNPYFGEKMLKCGETKEVITFK